MRHTHRSDHPVKRYTNSEIKARLILAIGICLGLTFMMSVGALLYGLLFVVQPLEVSPNDESAWATLNPLVLFMTGALSGVLASNGLKDKDKPEEPQS
jgi:H+/Cl- antiporter ClcA